MVLVQRCGSTVKNGLLQQHNNVTLLGHVSKIASILHSKLSDCPNTDTSLCYYTFNNVHGGNKFVASPNSLPSPIFA